MILTINFSKMRSFLAFLLFLNASILVAQTSATAHRKGFVIGGAVGLSALQLNYPTAGTQHFQAASFPNLKVGAMINPRLAILVNLPGTVYSYSLDGRKRDRGFEGIIPSVQYWPLDRVWVSGGAGLGMDAPAFYDIEGSEERKFYFGPSALAGAGYEIWRRRNMTFDIQGRVHYGKADTPDGNRGGWAFSLLLGVNFY